MKGQQRMEDYCIVAALSVGHDDCFLTGSESAMRNTSVASAVNCMCVLNVKIF